MISLASIAPKLRKLLQRLSSNKPDEVAAFFKPNEWNEMKVEGHGTKVTCWINGTKSAEIDDATRDGLLVEEEPGTDEFGAAAQGLGTVSAGVDWGMRRDAHAQVVISALPE